MKVNRDLYGRCSDSIFGSGAEKQSERECALRLIERRAACTGGTIHEILDYDLYGRGDPRIFGPEAHTVNLQETKRHLHKRGELISQGNVKVLGFSSKHAFLFSIRKIVLRRRPSLAEEMSIDPLTISSDEWADKISVDAQSESVNATSESVKDPANSLKSSTENAIFVSIGEHDQYEIVRGAGEIENILSVDDSSDNAPYSTAEKIRFEISSDEEKFESKTSSEHTISSSEKSVSATESDNTMTLTNSDRAVSTASSEKTAESSNESSSNTSSKISVSLVNSGQSVSTSSTKTAPKHKDDFEANLVQVSSDPISESAWFHPSQENYASDDESAHLTNTNDSKEDSAWFQKPKDENKSEKERGSPQTGLAKEILADHSDDDASEGVSECESTKLTVTDESSASNAWFHSRSKSECNSNSGSFKISPRAKSRASSGTAISRHTSTENTSLTEVETPASSRASSGGVYYSANLGSRGGSGGSGGSGVSGERKTSQASSAFRSNSQTTSSVNIDNVAMPRAVRKKISPRK